MILYFQKRSSVSESSTEKMNPVLAFAAGLLANSSFRHPGRAARTVRGKRILDHW